MLLILVEFFQLLIFPTLIFLSRQTVLTLLHLFFIVRVSLTQHALFQLFIQVQYAHFLPIKLLVTLSGDAQLLVSLAPSVILLQVEPFSQLRSSLTLFFLLPQV
jgi:hypothetical protein